MNILYLGNNSQIITMLEKKGVNFDLEINKNCLFFKKNYTIVLIDSVNYLTYKKLYPCLIHFKNIIVLYNNIEEVNLLHLNSYEYKYFLNNFELILKLFTYIDKEHKNDIINYVYNYQHLENQLKNRNLLANLHLYDLGHYYSNYGYMFVKKILNEFINIIASLLNTNEYDIFILGQSDYFITTKKRSKIELEAEIKKLINYFKLNTISIDGIDIKYKFKVALTFADNSFSLISKTLNNINKTKKFYQLNSDFKDNLLIEQQNNFNLARIINKAFIEEKLITYYQPIKNNKTNEIIMYECLIRYKDNNISPREFMPVLQKSRLTSLVTYTIIKQSFKKLSGRNEIISINICEEDLENQNFINFIKTQQQKYGISSNRINFEILETFSINNTFAIEQLRLLKDLGYKITLDNFGNNPSNFKTLFELEIDFIKINNFFIKKINDKKYSNIINGIITLTKALKAKTIAEYVDNPEIQKKVKELGIEYSEGFYIGKPNKEI